MNKNLENKDDFTPLSKLNLDETTVNAAKNGDKKAVLNKLSKEDLENLSSILNDKQRLESILKSPQAVAIFKAFGGKNG